MNKSKLIALVSAAAILILFLTAGLAYAFIGFHFAKFTSKGVLIPMAAVSECLPEMENESAWIRFYVSAQGFYERHISSEITTVDGYGLIPELMSPIGLNASCDNDILEMAQIYLERGADINAVGSFGKSAMFPVIGSANLSGLRFLLANNFNVCSSIKNSDGSFISLLEILEKYKTAMPDKYLSFHKEFLFAHQFKCSITSLKADKLPLRGNFRP